MPVELSIIIVNYNGTKYLDACFASLHRNLNDVSYEIIVFDNASTDNSCEYIRLHYPEVRLFANSENLGFGKGNNEAVNYAQGKYLLLINNDTIVQHELKEVLGFVKNNPDVGVAEIKMLDKNRKYLPAAGNFPNFLNMLRISKIFDLGTEFKTGVFNKSSYEVDWLGGSFMLLPKKVYVDVSGFDEDYFMYVEDVDLCRKIANNGYKRIFLPNYSYIHFVGYNEKRDPLVIEGCRLFIEKHLHGCRKILALKALALNKIYKDFKTNILR